MMSQITATPSALRPRNQASPTSTDANGNLICPTDTSCPVCPSDQECYQQARTSTSCAKYVCVPKSSLSRSSVPIGGIVGGVVGGLVVVAALAFVYYKFIYRKKHPRVTTEVAMDEMDADGSFLVKGDDSHLGEKSDRGPVRPAARRGGLANSVTKNRRLSAYESFMRPQARYTKRSGAGGSAGSTGTSAADSHGQIRGGMASYTNADVSKRNSIATTISTTNASNILPIAYIPGVTIRPTKNNTRSIYSYETELVFSDLNAIENASIVAERTGANQKTTMTAIRAQPKLVNVARIDEDDEEIDDLDAKVVGPNDSANNTWANDSANNTWDMKDLSVGTALYTANTLSINVHDHLDSDADSDVDSDIVEIGRATSTRHARQVVGDAGPNLVDVDHGDQELGSFILDIGVPQLVPP